MITLGLRPPRHRSADNAAGPRVGRRALWMSASWQRKQASTPQTEP